MDLSSILFYLWHMINMKKGKERRKLPKIKTHTTSMSDFLFEEFDLEEQGVQGLQVFAFSVITVNDEQTKPWFKIKNRG